jgi:hypothetical protein
MTNFTKPFYSVLLILTCFFWQNTFAQQPETPMLAKQNSTKVREIDSDSYFKVKTREGKKLKGKFDVFADDYFVSLNNDTIFFNEIKWIKAKTEWSKWQTGLAVTATFAGIWFSIGAIPAAFFVLATEGTAIVFLAPAATITSTVIGFRMLAGRKYKMKKWGLEIR